MGAIDQIDGVVKALSENKTTVWTCIVSDVGHQHNSRALCGTYAIRFELGSSSDACQQRENVDCYVPSVLV